MAFYARLSKVIAGVALSALIAAGATVLLVLPSPDSGVLSVVPSFAVTLAEAGVLVFASVLLVGLTRLAISARNGEPFIWLDGGEIHIRTVLGTVRSMPIGQVTGVESSPLPESRMLLPSVVLVTKDGFIAVPPVFTTTASQVIAQLREALRAA